MQHSAFLIIFPIVMESNPSHHSTLFFNTITSFCILIFLYFPNFYFKSILSPILISTLILLLLILRLATSQQQQQQQTLRLEPEPEQQYFKEDDVEWTVWGPLEVIHEGEEDEDEDEETQIDAYKGVSEKYGSLSLYYPETESDTDRDTSSSYSLDEDCLEIALDYEFDDKRGSVMNKLLNSREVDEEDNLIEIDISPNKIDECGFIW